MLRDYALLGNQILFCIYLSYSYLFILQTLFCKKKNMHTSQIITRMSGFTSDFFGALETTFTDNSLNNSKMDSSITNPNKSMIIRQLKEQSATKISYFMQKILKGVVLDHIYLAAEIKRRKMNRTPQNIYKIFYKLELRFSMKLSSFNRNAFSRILRFTQQYNMRDLYPQNTVQIIQQPPNLPISAANQISNPSYPTQIQKNNDTELMFTFSKKQIELPSQKIDVKLLKKTQEAIIMMDALQKIMGNKTILERAFKDIESYEYYLQKKSFIFELLTYITHGFLRQAFLKILNAQCLSKNQEKIKIISTPQSIKSQKFIPSIQYQSQKQIKNVDKQTYGLQTKIKFKRTSKYIASQKNIRQFPQSNYQESKQQNYTPGSSGLKFNKCFKKKLKTESQQKVQVTEQKTSKSKLRPKTKSKIKQDQYLSSPISHRKQPSQTSKTGIARILKLPKSKAYIIEANLKQKEIYREGKWNNVVNVKRNYYLTNQDLKIQVPDVQDQTLISIQSKLKDSNISSYAGTQSLSYSRRIHMIDNNKPLQFSNNKKKSKSKSKLSIERSRRAQLKSDEQQPETVNVQSLKSYYFPEQQEYGRAAISNKVVQPTNYIGSSKWQGNSKKRVSTQINLRTVKSSDKFNPYLQQLKQKLPKKQPEKVVTLHKMVQRSLSGRSSSKISRQSSKRQDKQHKQLIITSNQYKVFPRNMTPQSKTLIQHRRSPPSGVPKQWYFQNKNNYIGGPTSPDRNSKLISKPSQQIKFQKYIQNQFRN